MTENISVKELDSLIEQLAQKETEKDSIELNLKEKNKEISTLQNRLSEALRSLEREEYASPYGKVSFEEVLNVKLPTDENKPLLWDWMRSKGIFDRYATVNSISLKALFKAERNLAIENGEDPITFTLPGLEPATSFERIKFKAARK